VALHADGWVWLQLVLVASVAAPVVEETMFRGVFYRHLREATRRFAPALSVLASALVSSLLFAVIHPQGWPGVPLLTGLALAFALAREWRGSLVPHDRPRPQQRRRRAAPVRGEPLSPRELPWSTSPPGATIPARATEFSPPPQFRGGFFLACGRPGIYPEITIRLGVPGAEQQICTEPSPLGGGRRRPSRAGTRPPPATRILPFGVTHGQSARRLH
jgi:hypothetical protein